MDTVPSSPSRPQRRSRADRAQRLHSFSRSWRRALPAGIALTLLPLGLSHTAQAAASATDSSPSPADFHSAFTDDTTHAVVDPNGNGGVYYALINNGGGAITHSSSTGTGGVDTIASFSTNGNFYLTGGILAGSGASRSSTFTLTSSPLFQLSGGATLRNFTVMGAPVTMNGSGTLDNVTAGLAGTVTGTLTFANATSATVASGHSLYLGADNGANGALAGSGTVTLGGGSLFTGANTSNTIGSGISVSGTGSIQRDGVADYYNNASTLTNNGTIQASGGTLTVGDLTGFTNNALIEATSGSTLNFNNTVANATGTLQTDTGSVFNLGNTITVTGGTLQGTGAFTPQGTVSLTGVTDSAVFNLTAGSVIAYENTGIPNAFTLNNTMNVTQGNALQLGSGGDGSSQVLTGTGKVVLGDANSTTTTSDVTVAPNDNAVIASGMTVTTATGGAGEIKRNSTADYYNNAATLVNNGTLSASGTNSKLTIYDLTGFTNTSLITALSGGTVNLATNTVNTGGTLSAATGSTLNLLAYITTGGSITGAGTVNLLGAELSGVTDSAALSMIGDGNVLGTLTFTGGGSASVASGHGLFLGEDNGSNGALAGTATVTLNSGGLFTGANTSNTIGSGISVSGTGSIQRDGAADYYNNASALTNNGVIQATGGTLTVGDLTGFTNNGLLTALSGGTLALNVSVTNSGGTLASATGGTLSIGAVNVTGGSITGAGTVSLLGAALSGVTDSAALSMTAGDGQVLGILNFIGAGSANVAASHSLYLGADNGANGALAGSGTVTLGGGSLFTTANTSDTIGAGVTVSGTGSIQRDANADYYGNVSALTNSGSIRAGGGTLTVQDLPTFTSSEGNFAAVNGGTLNVSSALTSGSTGTVTTAAGSTVNLNNSLTQDQGTSQIDGIVNMGNGNTLIVTGGTLKGTGTVNGNVTQTGGTVAPGDSPGTLSVTGTFNGSGGGVLSIEYTASQTAPTAHDLLAVSGAVTLGGQRLDVSFVGPPNANGTYLATTGEPGTSFDFLSFGTLTNGGLGGLFSNEFTQSGNFYVNGIASNNVGSSPAVYQLTQNGNALHLTLTTAAAPEPSQWAAFGLGVLGLAGLGLRARRKAAQSA